MNKNYIEGKTFDKIDFSVNALPVANYECCTFRNCNFSEADLSNSIFSACDFSLCNLSMAKLFQTGFREVKFKECKLAGLHFETCNHFLFSVSFETCLLSFSSFYKLNLKKTIFKNSTLHEVDFAEVDLTESAFFNCDLMNTIFDNTLLEKVDFRTSFNYSINPTFNRIKKAKFSLNGILGLLQQYDIEIE